VPLVVYSPMAFVTGIVNQTFPDESTLTKRG
jgi:hypothetical protein